MTLALQRLILAKKHRNNSAGRAMAHQKEINGPSEAGSGLYSSDDIVIHSHLGELNRGTWTMSEMAWFRFFESALG
jgi:hypothetical protein